MESSGEAISVFLALGAGVLSFASPCVLPLVPAYISFVAGVSLKELTDAAGARVARRAALINSILFILGFSFVFVALGATASLLGGLLYDYLDWVKRVGGAIIILFGVHLTGIFRLGALQTEKRFRVTGKRFGYASSFLIGIAFGAGWTPCVGPILGSILVLASTKESVGQGMILLGFYSAGIGIPLLGATLAMNAFLKFFARLKKWLHAIEIGSGVLLIVLGVLLLTDQFTALTGYLAQFTLAK